MKKRARSLLKVIFGRTILVMLLVTIQFAILLGTFFALSTYIGYLYSGFTIIGVVVTIYILNTDINPNFKLAWIMPIVAFPVVGALFYLYFKFQIGNRVVSRKLTVLIQESKKDLIQDEEVMEAAKKAVVHDNIMNFNQQYETVLGERGITLSGGQKQRVSIARALIKNAPILLLDDCLSAVDTETEETILNNLLAYCKDKTTIIVSHRVSSAKNADQIIILEEGKIIEQGTHNQLLDNNGYYKQLYIKQLSEKEID